MRNPDIKTAAVVLLLVIGWIVFGSNFAADMISDDAEPSAAGALLITALVPCTYFLPFIIAMIRRKTGRTQIFLVNLIFGLTVVGWIIALIMAFGSDSSDKSTDTQTHVTVIQHMGDNIDSASKGGEKSTKT